MFWGDQLCRCLAVPCHHPKPCRTLRSENENWEMQCKLCFQRVDQISGNGLKFRAWMVLAEAAFLRLVPAPGWNKAVSVTGISPSWFSHLNFKAHCRWRFDKTAPELPGNYFTEDYWSEECCLDTQGTEESPSKAEGTPPSCGCGTTSAVPGLGLSWCSDRPREVWRCCFLLYLGVDLGVAVSQSWLLLNSCFLLYLFVFFLL